MDASAPERAAMTTPHAPSSQRAPAQPISLEPDAPRLLRRALRRAERRRAAWTCVSLLAAACGIAAASVLLFAALDPAADASPFIRAAVLASIAVVIGLALIASAVRLLRPASEQDVAAWLDSARTNDQPRVRHVVQLLGARPPHGATALLAARAVQHALAYLSTHRISLALAAPRRRAALLWVAAGTLLAAIALAGLVAPRWILTAAQRLTHPTDTMPPWSATQLSLASSALVPPLGGDVTLRVRIEGPISAAPELWLTSRSSDEPSRLTMRPTDDAREFSATVRDVRTPLVALARTANARSRPLHITPATDARLVRAWAVITPPAYTRLAPTTHDLPHAQPAIALPQGSRVAIFLQATAAMRGGSVHASSAADPNTRIAVDATARADSAGGLEVAFDLLGPGLASLVITPSLASGGDAPFTLSLSLDGRADQPPSIEWTRVTAPFASAPQHGVLNLRAAAHDDVAVSRTGLLAAQFDARGIFRGMRWIESSDSSHTRGDAIAVELPLPLAPLGLDVGDTLRIWAAAIDDRPPALGGPQIALTSAAILRITASDAHAPSGPISPGASMPLITQAGGSASSDEAAEAAPSANDAKSAPAAPSQNAHAANPPTSGATSIDDAQGPPPAPADASTADRASRPTNESDARDASSSVAASGSAARDDGVLGGASNNDDPQPAPPPRALTPPTGLIERITPNSPTPAPAPSSPGEASNAVAPADRELAQRYFRLLEQFRRAPASDPRGPR
jgi:hypothetical protein